MDGKKSGHNKSKSNHVNSANNTSLEIDVSSDKGSTFTAIPPQSSPTWSSRSSVCGSTGTGITSRKSQSSCGMSGTSIYFWLY